MLQLIDYVKETSNETALAVTVGGLVLYFFAKCIYNIYFHPLSHIPGPKLAIIGPYLEFYHDVVRDGQYLWEIKKMHEKYGMRKKMTRIPLDFL